MPSGSFALFTTAISTCAIAWGARGLLGIWLPERSSSALRSNVLRRWPDAVESVPAEDIAAVVESIIRLLAGARVAFDAVRLDFALTSPFDRRVYEVTRSIPAGEVLTYGEVAARVGDGSSARAVGQALGRNPWPIVVPCHRVVAAGNAFGGFSAPGGTLTKLRLLAIERARRAGAPDLFDSPPTTPSPRATSAQIASPVVGTDTALSCSTGVLIDPSGRS